jgi:uncharacterized iron-regulated protein
MTSRRRMRAAGVAAGAVVSGIMLLGLGGCAGLTEGAGGLPAGRVYETTDGRLVPAAAVVAALAEADFVLLGERHGNPEHHRLQAELVRALQARWPQPAPVAFEMMTTDQQLIIVEHRDASGNDAAGLGAALAWETSGWPDWTLYAPIAQAAFDADAEVVAANLPQDEVRAVFDAGAAALSPALLRRTGLDRPFPQALEVALRRELLESHCGSVPPEVVDGMFQVQRARDAMMADRLAALAGDGRGILIAGAGHVRSDRGVPWYLARLRPDAIVASLTFVEADDPESAPPPRQGLPYDYVWFTEAVPRPEDPCAGLGERLESLGEGSR